MEPIIYDLGNGFQQIMYPDGTTEIVPIDTSNNLPFSIADLAAKSANVDSFPAPQDFYTSPTYIAKQNVDPYFQGIISQVPNRTSVPFGTSVDNFQGFTDKEDFSTPKKSSGIKDLFRTLLGFTIPGFSALKNFEGQPYQRFTKGATIKDGIYSIGDFNQPVGLVNDFYNPNTGLNRFQRAEERFKRTGSMKDLFAASRSGAEFFRRRRELIDAQTKAALDKRKAERDILQFTSGTDTGPGKDTFDPSGGAGGTYDSSFDYGGSSKQAADRRSSDLGFSDIRLKENVELIGKSPSNINIYKFNYKNSPTTYQGVMAHEVPWANVKHNNGYMMVDYNKVDVEFKKWLK